MARSPSVRRFGSGFLLTAGVRLLLLLLQLLLQLQLLLLSKKRRHGWCRELRRVHPRKFRLLACWGCSFDIVTVELQ